MISQSVETLPAMTELSRGKIVCRYNHRTVDVGDSEDGAMVTEFEYVLVDAPVTRASLIDAIINDRYDKSAEIAFINNRGTEQGDIEYAEYQAFRFQAKAWADEILAEVID